MFHWSAQFILRRRVLFSQVLGQASCGSLDSGIFCKYMTMPWTYLVNHIADRYFIDQQIFIQRWRKPWFKKKIKAEENFVSADALFCPLKSERQWGKISLNVGLLYAFAWRWLDNSDKRASSWFFFGSSVTFPRSPAFVRKGYSLCLWYIKKQ